MQVHGPCPFYLARELAASAELVFLPYNYLVDTKTRTTIKQLTWEGAVLIFDEAHNLEVHLLPRQQRLRGDGLDEC